MNFFGIGPLELLFVIMLALLVLGPNRMVDVARTLGKYVRETQRATSELPRLISLDDEPTPSRPASGKDKLPDPKTDEDSPRSPEA